MYFSSAALARKIEALACKSWAPVALSPAHGYVLLLTIDNPGIQPGEIARELQLKPSTITRFIEKLEEKTLVIRTTSGKITNVYPTPKGKEMYPQLKACMADFYTRYATILGPDNSADFVTKMNSVSDLL
jgi:DNA-binding MarR family transcriptional regulator